MPWREAIVCGSYTEANKPETREQRAAKMKDMLAQAAPISYSPFSEVPNMIPSVAPWLSVRGGAAAADFYKRAFDATEKFRLENGGSVVARLAIGGSEIWVSDESPEHHNFSPDTLNGSTCRMILNVPNPDGVFACACEAGARVVHPVGEQHGWRVGRVVDPFGHHWEIARELAQ